MGVGTSEGVKIWGYVTIVGVGPVSGVPFTGSLSFGGIKGVTHKQKEYFVVKQYYYKNGIIFDINRLSIIARINSLRIKLKLIKSNEKQAYL
jgi:hypothetical protein